MKYCSIVLAVRDMKAARAFYEDLFGLTVLEDYGKMVGFDCGLSLQEEFDWLTGMDRDQMKWEENNCELYFETEDFDAFFKKLQACPGLRLLHEAKESPWGQRAIRFYDPDCHLIEVGESMRKVAQRFLSQGMTMEETARRMDVKPLDVRRMLEE